MTISLAKVTGDELSTLLGLNEAAIPHVNSICLDDMKWFIDNAVYFRVAWLAGDIAGFLIALLPGTNYASSNYRWFCARYPNFTYIDRVVVAEYARRCGVGRLLYEDVAVCALQTAPLLACEVNIRPRNEASMRFHERLGFVNAGFQDTENGTKTVSFLTKDLGAAI